MEVCQDEEGCSGRRKVSAQHLVEPPHRSAGLFSRLEITRKLCKETKEVKINNNIKTIPSEMKEARRSKLLTQFNMFTLFTLFTLFTMFTLISLFTLLTRSTLFKRLWSKKATMFIFNMAIVLSGLLGKKPDGRSGSRLGWSKSYWLVWSDLPGIIPHVQCTLCIA